MEENRRLVGFGAIHSFGSSKEKKSRFGTLIFVSMEHICMEISHLKYGFVG